MSLDIITSPLLDPLRHGFFGREGGASSGIFAGLNCGQGSTDQAEAVTINRARVAQAMGLGPEAPALAVPGFDAFGVALTSLVLAQIPLTFGNSIVATADAEREYFGARARRVTPRRLAASIGGANAFAGLFGGLPVCHGAGGVTAHYKLGARTWVATAMAGALLLSLGVAFGSSLPAILQLVPPGVLAGMLMFVAIQHGMLAARLDGAGDRAIAVGVGVITLLAGNLAIGFAAGAAVLVARGALRGTIAPSTGEPV